MSKLWSWQVVVRTTEWRSVPDGWGDMNSHQVVKSWYVVAPTRASAIQQAKNMSGYYGEEATSRRHVLSLRRLAPLT